MEKTIKEVISTNCYLPRPDVSKVVVKILGREPTEKEKTEIYDFIRGNTLPGCSFFFSGCKEKNDCAWKHFL